ncbi:MAG: preprotein translocase subunit YajC [Rickettsiales bacterium]|nr:preprotein translocase subunit YajC [Rickettsiales bacterium]
MILDELFISAAMAQEGVPSGGEVSISSFVPLILIFVIFYFFIIRPQSKKYKEHQEMINTLKVGNKVIIGNGIIGKINSISNKEPIVDVEIADDVIIKVQRNSISDVVLDKKDTKKENKKKHSKK